MKMFKRKNTESKMPMNEEEDSYGHIEGNLALWSSGLHRHREVPTQHHGVAFSSGLLRVWDEVSSAEASFESF